MNFSLSVTNVHVAQRKEMVDHTSQRKSLLTLMFNVSHLRLMKGGFPEMSLKIPHINTFKTLLIATSIIDQYCSIS